LHDQDGVISVLDNREGSIRPLGKRGQKIAKEILSVDDILKEVSSNSKEKRGEGSPCLTPLEHLKSLPAVPLRRTEEVAVDSSSSTHFNHFGGKPLA
jgi:hypothetical protein